MRNRLFSGEGGHPEQPKRHNRRAGRVALGGKERSAPLQERWVGQFDAVPAHSSRKTVTGFTVAARQAGIAMAIIAIPASTSTTPARVAGSRGLTP